VHRGRTESGRRTDATAPIGRAARALGPLLPLAGFVAAMLAILGGARLLHVALRWPRIAADVSLPQLLLAGLRIDVSTVSLVAFLPCMFLLLVPASHRGWRGVLVNGWFTLWTGVAVFFEVATVPFMDEFDSRLNRLFFEEFATFKEVADTLLADYKVPLALAAITLIVCVGLSVRGYGRLLRRSAPWPVWLRLTMVFPCFLAAFAGARGTLGHRALNISSVAISSNQLVNQLALNSTYSLGYSFYMVRHEGNPARVYGEAMPDDEVFRTVRLAANMPPEPVDAQSPLSHVQHSRLTVDRPRNVVIVLEEGLGAEYVGTLGGLPLTPELDRLSQEGLLLTRLYSTGVRTVRGIEAVVSGFLPTPGRSVVKLTNSQTGFFTLPGLLQDRGYETEFIYGGMSNFDNMRSFMTGNGFARIYDQPSFVDPEFLGTWGVCDDDLFDKAHEIFIDHGDRPFFALLLTTSNHSPYEFPAGTIELYEQPSATEHNAMKYADHALGRFFRKAKTADYFANTIFVVVADHNTRTYGNELVPVDKFRIPGLFIGPDVPVERYDDVASQIDLAPTILDLLGIDAEHPMIGRSLLGLAPGEGRAIMQFHDNNAYMRGDDVVIHLPRAAPRQFVHGPNGLEPAALDPELERVALAHALLPGLVYYQRSYR
jgi:phosphoglycerol transferase MdoB-like AlkP superfamily enzyme